MDKEELLKEIMKLPKVETNNAVGSMDGINIDDLMSAVDRFNKVPDYNDLLKENKQLKKQNNNFKTSLDESQEVILDYIKENQALKKKLENKYEKVGVLTNEILYEENTKIIEENEKLKSQLEEINKFVCKCGYANIEQVMLNYCGLLTQRQEFIKYLEDEIKKTMDTMELLSDTGSCRIPYLKSKKNVLEKILQKYKEIIGDDK